MLKLELTEDELRNLMALIDAGIKAAGMQAVLPAAPIIQKIDAAIKAAQTQEEESD